MKNIILIVVAALLSMSISAQKKQKIKGNGIVVEEYKDLDNFSEIEINDDLEVFLMQSNNEGYRLKTDSNLASSVRIEVVNHILKVYTSSRITSNKKLEIYITFQTLDKITLHEDSKLKGQNFMKLSNLSINCYDNSEFDLDLESDEFKLEMDNSASGKIKLKSSNANIILNDNGFLKGTLSSNDLNIAINKRADMNVKGNSDNLNLITSGSSDVKAKKLHATNVTINASNTSDIYVHASKQLNVFAKGRSYIYVYGNPEINVDGLNDKSQIIKK